jgi:hypothetical protein
MRHLLTVSAIAACVAILTGCVTHAVVADSTAEADRPLLLLEETHRLMLELAERDLPRGNIDEGVLAKQRRVIKNLDMLIALSREHNEKPDGRTGGMYLPRPVNFNCIVECIKLMISEQEGIIELTERVDKERLAFEKENPNGKFELGKVLRNAIRDACCTQKDLAELSRIIAMTFYLEGKIVFPTVLEMTADDMNLVVSKLRSHDTGEETQVIEEAILRNLRRIIQAVHRDLQTLREKLQDSSGGGSPHSGRSDENHPDTSSMPVLLDIRFLKILQLDVLNQTRRFMEARSRGIEAAEASNRLSPGGENERRNRADVVGVRIGKRLARRQRRIAELAGALLNAIEKTHDKETER